MSRTYKLRDFKPGETLASHGLSPESLAALSDMVFGSINSNAPAETMMVRIDLDVELMTIVPAAQGRFYKIKIPLKTKATAKKKRKPR